MFASEDGPGEDDVDFNRHFGQNLARLRKKREMSVQQLAAAIGVHRSTIFGYEAEENPNPTLSVLLSLQVALDLASIEQLLGGFLEFPSRGIAPSLGEEGQQESA